MSSFPSWHLCCYCHTVIQTVAVEGFHLIIVSVPLLLFYVLLFNLCVCFQLHLFEVVLSFLVSVICENDISDCCSPVWFRLHT